MIKVGIVDDRESDLRMLANCLDSYRSENAIEMDVALFSSASDFLEKYAPDFDILLLDIEMPGMNGLELAKEIRLRDQLVTIVFVTNIAQYALNGYEVEAFDYIVKPVDPFSFKLKINRVISRSRIRNKNYFIINYQNSILKIDQDDVRYLEADGHYVTIHTREKDYTFYSTMKKIIEKIKGGGFAFCNRCYYVNLRYVYGIDGDTCLLYGSGSNQKISLSISRPTKRSFVKAFANYIGGVPL